MRATSTSTSTSKHQHQFKPKMSSALKQVIVNAIVKIAGQNPAREVEGEPTAEQARDEFIRLLIAELFPESPAVPAVKEKKKPGPKPKLDENGEPIKKPKTVPSPDSLGEPSPGTKERKPRTPMSEEQKAAMVAKRKATMEAKKAAPEAPAEPSPKKEKKEKTAEEKAAIAAKRKATMEAKKAAEPAPATPKAEVPALPPSPPKAPKKAKKAPEPSTANLDKFTPTQTKKLKEIVGDKVDKKEVLTYLNGLSNAAYNDKKLEDHFRDYAATLAPPAPAPEPEREQVDLVSVEFDGESYAVNPETKRVYTVDENGNATAVGYVGMAKFETLEMPTESEDEGEE